MRTLIALVGMSLLCLSSKNGVPASGNFEREGQWTIIKETGILTVFERWVALQNGSNLREIKGEMILESTVSAAVDLITDVSRSKSWMSGISEAYLIKRDEKGSWYTYTLFKMPWPFEKREMVSQISLTYDRKIGNALIAVKSIDELMPSHAGIIRLTNYRATWIIEKFTDGKVKITFTAASNNPPAFPRWIQDPIVKKLFADNLINLGTILE